MPFIGPRKIISTVHTATDTGFRDGKPIPYNLEIDLPPVGDGSPVPRDDVGIVPYRMLCKPPSPEPEGFNNVLKGTNR